MVDKDLGGRRDEYLVKGWALKKILRNFLCTVLMRIQAQLHSRCILQIRFFSESSTSPGERFWLHVPSGSQCKCNWSNILRCSGCSMAGDTLWIQGLIIPVSSSDVDVNLKCVTLGSLVAGIDPDIVGSGRFISNMTFACSYQHGKQSTVSSAQYSRSGYLIYFYQLPVKQSCHASSSTRESMYLK